MGLKKNLLSSTGIALYGKLVGLWVSPAGYGRHSIFAITAPDPRDTLYGTSMMVPDAGSIHSKWVPTQLPFISQLQSMAVPFDSDSGRIIRDASEWKGHTYPANSKVSKTKTIAASVSKLVFATRGLWKMMLARERVILAFAWAFFSFCAYLLDLRLTVARDGRTSCGGSLVMGHWARFGEMDGVVEEVGGAVGGASMLAPFWLFHLLGEEGKDRSFERLEGRWSVSSRLLLDLVNAGMVTGMAGYRVR
ncbi:hypothetical protein BJ508DRAFT_305194 [Ascobolus immersus RN42]|uniref:Uncharacterized protein n=1 Tax=Ascobolus immersus RN42 TaxID=1160509 RepID=A0A3N4IMR9_ASCIM|nr:hypothetical protein BJ508DRAFT_305194 [Ascobolus immersus RN42]